MNHSWKEDRVLFLKSEKALEEEFPEYLPKDWGLKRGIEAPIGWHQIIREMFHQLREKGFKPEFIQIKEKFGQLRIYSSNNSNESYQIIKNAGKKSKKTCQTCGKPGSIRQSYFWLGVYCEEHKPKEKN